MVEFMQFFKIYYIFRFGQYVSQITKYLVVRFGSTLFGLTGIFWFFSFEQKILVSSSNNFEVQITTRFYVHLNNIKPLNGKHALKKFQQPFNVQTTSYISGIRMILSQ